jgi:hypothetical protein
VPLPSAQFLAISATNDRRNGAGVDQMGEVGEQCGHTIDKSSQLSFLLFYRFDIGLHFHPIGLLRRVDEDRLIIFDAPQAPG